MYLPWDRVKVPTEKYAYKRSGLKKVFCNRQRILKCYWKGQSWENKIYDERMAALMLKN